MTALPSIDLVRTLPARIERTVPEDFIDVNGHMNIVHFFDQGAWAPWILVGEMGIDADYIEREQQSFFTVEHHVRYLGELRLGEAFSVRAAFVGRTPKAMHAISFVVDEERDTIACTMEIMYVHVSTATRRSVPISDEIGASLDASIALSPWVADVATGLTLRR